MSKAKKKMKREERERERERESFLHVQISRSALKLRGYTREVTLRLRLSRFT